MENSTIRHSISPWVVVMALLAINFLPSPIGFLTAMPSVRLMFSVVLTSVVVLTFCALIIRTTNLWVGAFLMLAVLSAHYPLVDNHSKGTLMYVLFGVLWYYICVHSLDMKKALLGIRIVAIANLFMLLLQYFGLDFLHKNRYTAILSGFSGDVPVGLLSAPIEVSSLLAICLPAFFCKWWAWGLIAFIPAFAFSRTFGGPLSIVVASLVAVFILYREWFVRAPFIVVSVYFLFLYMALFDFPDTTWRLIAWKKAFSKDLYFSNPFWGFGLGHWKTEFYKLTHLFDGHPMVHAHNEFLQGVFESGVLFAVIAGGYFVDVWKRYNREAFLAVVALVVIIVNSMTFFPFHNPLIAAVIILWLAILERQLRLFQVRSCSVSLSAP